jgi:hypothetical protein
MTGKWMAKKSSLTEGQKQSSGNHRGCLMKYTPWSSDVSSPLHSRFGDSIEAGKIGLYVEQRCAVGCIYSPYSQLSPLFLQEFNHCQADRIGAIGRAGGKDPVDQIFVWRFSKKEVSSCPIHPENEDKMGAVFNISQALLEIIEDLYFTNLASLPPLLGSILRTFKGRMEHPDRSEGQILTEVSPFFIFPFYFHYQHLPFGAAHEEGRSGLD